MFGKDSEILLGPYSFFLKVNMKFQSPCAGNMFGKRLLLVNLWLRLCVCSFNPRVRGTCLVSYYVDRVEYDYVVLRGFNPRVRGTCLVSVTLPCGVKRKEGGGFQSPCAGNMFGKSMPYRVMRK